MLKTQQSEIRVECRGESISLRGDGTVYLPSTHSLLVADLHFGKAASFRAHGVPVPIGSHETDLKRLSVAIDMTQANQLVFLGDLVHDAKSLTPKLIETFSVWRNQHSSMKLTLVRGNHDRHVRTFPDAWNMNVVDEVQMGPFNLVHETTEPTPDDEHPFQMGGHWHPVTTVGRGSDRMRLRCFVLSEHDLVLPAFGSFTGGMNQTRKQNQRYFVIGDSCIWPVD
ncbi:MAG: ligase-associated DNA damage response endonuclease PdeM [Planctomycetota bacterium]